MKICLFFTTLCNALKIQNCNFFFYNYSLLSLQFVSSNRKEIWPRRPQIRWWKTKGSFLFLTTRPKKSIIQYFLFFSEHFFSGLYFFWGIWIMVKNILFLYKEDIELRFVNSECFSFLYSGIKVHPIKKSIRNR